MRRLLLAFFVPATAACNAVGPDALTGARFDYNEEIAHSWNDQLLLNLVRLRYRDTPQFLEVGSVLAQYTFNSSAGVSPVIGVDGGSSNETTLGFNVGYEERPTITLVPLQGDDFTRRLLTPISNETLLFLSQAGWSVSRLLMMGVQRLDRLSNMPRAAGPTPDVIDFDPRFGELVGLLRELQVTDALQLVAIKRPDGSTGTRLLLEAGDGEQTRAMARVRELLGLAEDASSVDLSAQPTATGQLRVQSRSLMGVMFFLSHAVEVPAGDIETGRVTVSRTPTGAPIDWSAATGGLLRIRSSSSRPADVFVAIRYRRHWFYIDDRDLESKTTFFLLSSLFSLQAASSSGIAPALTVSAGG